jgi:hypothetical protein
MTQLNLFGWQEPAHQSANLPDKAHKPMRKHPEIYGPQPKTIKVLTFKNRKTGKIAHLTDSPITAMYANWAYADYFRKFDRKPPDWIMILSSQRRYEFLSEAFLACKPWGDLPPWAKVEV